LNRKVAITNLQVKAVKMLRTSKQKFQPAKFGETIRIRVPDVDLSKMDPQNILSVVLDIVDNDFYKLATKNGAINRLYTRNQFSVCKENFKSITDVQRDQQISLREASTSNSLIGGQGYTRCNCKTKCITKKCKCRNVGILCSTQCHDSLSCCNK